MHDTLKYTLIFTAGATTGFLLAKKLLEEKYKALAQEEIDSVKAIRRPEMGRTVAPDVTEQTFIGSKSSLDGVYTNKYTQTKRDYRIVVDDEYIKNKIAAREDLSDEHTDEDIIEATDVNKEGPYVIDETEFADEMPHYDKLTWYYYILDDVLTEEDGESIVDDVDKTVGYDSLSQLDLQSTVWVRNDRLATDYEVVKFEKSYQEQILGIRTDYSMLREPPKRERIDEDD